MPVAVPNKTYEQLMLQGCTGINNSVSDELIADTDLADARNVIPDFGGGGNLIKRGGVKAQCTAANYAANTSVTVPSVYYGQLGTGYFAEVQLGASPTFHIYNAANAASLYSANSTSAIAWPSWRSFLTYDLYSDGLQAVKTSDGSTFTPIANFPANATAIEPYNGYLFTLAANNALRWSNTEDPETWPADHELKFTLSDRYDALVSLASWDVYLAVLSRKRTFLVQGFGDLDFTVVKKITAAGGSSPINTISTPFGIFSWSFTYGLCRLSESGIDFPMLRKLPATLHLVRKYTPGNAPIIYRAKKKCVSMYLCADDQQPSALNSTYRMDYYPETDAFYLHDGAAGQVAGACTFDAITTSFQLNTEDEPVYLLYQTANNLSVRLEDDTIYTDMDAAYTSYLLTKRFAQGSPSVEKRARKLILTTSLATAGNITHTAYMDNNAAGVATTYSVGTGVQDTKIGHDMEHHKIQHKFSDALTTKVEYYRAVENGYYVRED